MTESEIKTLFLEVVGTLNLCQDVNLETPSGEIIEYGMAISDIAYITYRESDRTLHFYLEGEELLTLDETSPLLYMMRELLIEVEEGDPRELTRAHLRVLK